MRVVTLASGAHRRYATRHVRSSAAKEAFYGDLPFSLLTTTTTTTTICPVQQSGHVGWSFEHRVAFIYSLFVAPSASSPASASASASASSAAASSHAAPTHTDEPLVEPLAPVRFTVAQVATLRRYYRAALGSGIPGSISLGSVSGGDTLWRFLCLADTLPDWFVFHSFLVFLTSSENNVHRGGLLDEARMPLLPALAPAAASASLVSASASAALVPTSPSRLPSVASPSLLPSASPLLVPSAAPSLDQLSSLSEDAHVQPLLASLGGRGHQPQPPQSYQPYQPYGGFGGFGVDNSGSSSSSSNKVSKKAKAPKREEVDQRAQLAENRAMHESVCSLFLFSPALPVHWYGCCFPGC